MVSQALRVISVNVALPRVLGVENGEPVLSAIAKQPVLAAWIEVGRTNLAGDLQGDLENHGGPEKAVYGYPADHWTWWEKEQHFPCAPGAFGENLTLIGADETAVHIGDRFSWGEALLEVAQPRMPCFKFLLHSGRADAGMLMTVSGRCGWYFRVLATGAAPTVGAWLTRVEEGGGPSVRETFAAAFGRRVTDTRRREIAANSSLSDAWRKRLLAMGS